MRISTTRTRQRFIGTSVIEGAERFLKEILRNPLNVFSALAVLCAILVAVLADVVAPSGPNKVGYGSILSDPGGKYWFGTDQLGRDVFSRVVYGARISLIVGLMSVLIGSVVGGLTGLISGYLGGVVDGILQRIVDMVMAFPVLILGLTIMAILGASLVNVILAISIPFAPRIARLVRSEVLRVRETVYVEAARAVACSTPRIMFRHVLPNTLPTYIVMCTSLLGNAILLEASLSFLGLGVPPPNPSWGRMIAGDNPAYLEAAPWMALFPGIALSMTVLGFSVMGDVIRDLLDPRISRA